MLLLILTVLAAAAGTTVDLGSMIPLLTAVSGIMMGFMAARRSEKADKVQQENSEVTSLIQGYTNQIGAYSDIVRSLQNEIARLRAQMDEDREIWEQERQQSTRDRASLKDKVVTMQLEIETLKSEARK
jgi:flagellar biosynthesis chaperone FliJ